MVVNFCAPWHSLIRTRDPRLSQIWLSRLTVVVLIPSFVIFSCSGCLPEIGREVGRLAYGDLSVDVANKS